MSDLRFDPIFQQWVAIAEIRRERPLEFLPVDQIRKQIICPFCRGNEDETPLPLAAWDRSGRPLELPALGRWSTRVIPNKYPTYEPGRRGGLVHSPVYPTCQEMGLQELILPTPRHVCSLSQLEPDELAVALRGAQARMKVWRQEGQVQHAMFFKNCRHEAGASIEHTHFQLLGSPRISPFLAGRAERFAAAQRAGGGTLFTQLLEFEVDAGTRMVAETKDWIAFCPFASRLPFQTWWVPRQQPPAFESAGEELLRGLVDFSRRLVSRLELLLGEPAYNWMLHQLPFQASGQDHWFVEIVPRISKIAGYELGTDIWVNSVAPETAAKRLRS